MFQAQTAISKEPFTRESGQKLGEALCEKLENLPKACWLFCSPKAGLENLLKGVAEAVGTDILVGCTTDGEISDRGISAKSAVLAGVVSNQIDFEVVMTENIGKDAQKAGERLAEQFSLSATYIQLFSDGLTANGCEILKGVQSVLGKAIPISGGTAGDDGRFVRTWQFAGNRVFSNAAVAIGFSGSFRVGLGVHSGWSPVGLAKKITKAKGNILYELNHEPALKVYERFLGKHANKLPSVGVEYPLGLIDRYWTLGDSDYCLLRATMSVNRNDGSITFAGDVPEGTMVRLTCADSASILDAAGRATRMALDQLEKTSPVMTFVYSCMARKIVLGRRITEELDQILQNAGQNIPVVGFFTYGEFSPVIPCGTCVLHNETVTVALIGV
jgi:hypothetical protein